MADFFSSFGKSFELGLERRRLRESLGAEIEDREAERARKESEFNETMELRRDEFEATQEHRANQESRAQQDLTLREAGVGVQFENLEQRKSEAEALETYRIEQTKIQQQQVDIQKRSADLTLAQAMMKAFDPAVPKAARGFLLTSMAKQLQIDPKSDEFKELHKAVMGLEDEALASLRTSISAMLPKAKPGDVMAFAQSIMSGKMSLAELTETMGNLSTQQTREEITGSLVDQNLIKPSDSGMPSGSMGSKATAPEADQASVVAEHRAKAVEFARAGMHEDARVQLQLAREIETGKEFDPKARGEVRAAEKTAEIEALKKQPLKPSIKRLLGFSGDMTQGEASELGVSTDLLEDPKQVVDLFKQKGATQTALKNIDELSAMVEGRPELIGSVGGMVRAIDSILEQVSAIPALSEAILNGNLGEFKEAKEVKNIVDRALAGKSAVIRSRIIDLSYEIATARESGRLSNQDVERALAGIGESGSAEQFTAVLTDLSDRLREGTAKDIETITGIRPLDLMTTDQLLLYADESDNPAILKSVLKEVNRRGK